MDDFVRHFGIDAKLLLAQAANFLLLLFILKRYAYGPLLKMMKTRKDEIAKGIQFTKDGNQNSRQHPPESGKRGRAGRRASARGRKAPAGFRSPNSSANCPPIAET